MKSHLRSRFRIKLFLIMILFSVTITFLISMYDNMRLREQVLQNNQLQVQQIEEAVLTSLHTLESLYFYFDRDTAAKMKANSNFLIDLYEKSPDFAQWDFAELKNLLGMDIYIIDEHNVIQYSSFPEDVGLDFADCCGKLVPVLNERRALGGFYHDGIDTEQQTGKIKKYSYMATEDKKYLIELGYSLEDGEIYQQFNLSRTLRNLEQKYPSINEINIFNIGGIAFGESAEVGKLSSERRAAFEQTLKSKETMEIINESESTVHRYVHYVSNFDDGTTKDRVIEIIYNENDLQALLDANKNTYIYELAVSIAFAFIVSFVVSGWVSLPMYLAFHDSLTGLLNRAAYNEYFKSVLLKSKGMTALLTLDLDNFKLINDKLGHDEGDRLLKRAARDIRSAIRKEDEVFRWGGDEFVIVMPSTSLREVHQRAANIIQTISDSVELKEEWKKVDLTVSMGISFAPEHGTNPDDLYKKADIALYASKEKGKNQYQIYDDTNDVSKT